MEKGGRKEKDRRVEENEWKKKNEKDGLTEGGPNMEGGNRGHIGPLEGRGTGVGLGQLQAGLIIWSLTGSRSGCYLKSPPPFVPPAAASST